MKTKRDLGRTGNWRNGDSESMGGGGSTSDGGNQLLITRTHTHIEDENVARALSILELVIGSEK